MKKGDSVIVKTGILDDSFNEFNIKGWQGRIIKMIADDEDKTAEIAWDSITLRQMPRRFIIGLFENKDEYETMYLHEYHLKVTKPRDEKSDVKIAFKDIKESYCYKTRKQHEKSIEAILKEKELAVTDERQEIYFGYIKKNLKKPCTLTGAEILMTEDEYFRSKTSINEKGKPNITDHFEFIALADKIEPCYGIMAEVKRKSDKKRFTLPLCELEAMDVKSKNHELLSDYTFWMGCYG